jgi:putative transposase
MVSPTDRRRWVGWVQEAFCVSERRACDVGHVHRAMIRYVSIRPPQDALRQRLRELAHARMSYGYKRLHVLLRREGWVINHKRVHRLYREEGLTQKTKGPKRRKSTVTRTLRPMPGAPNERWAMDFIHDTFANGTAFRVFSVIDLYTRECVALVPQTRFRGEDVAAWLSAVGAARGLPTVIQADNGTEFTSKALDHWAYWNQVRLDFSRPGKPTDNASIESFHNSFRRECLTQHYFLDLPEARRALDNYQAEYNNFRPHSSLANQPPAHFRAQVASTPASTSCQKVSAGGLALG